VLINDILSNIDVKGKSFDLRFLLFFIKKKFLKVFYFLNVFYFLVGKICNSTKPGKLVDKTTFKLWIEHGSYRKFSDEEP